MGRAGSLTDLRTVAFRDTLSPAPDPRMDAAERSALIETYEAGPARLRRALDAVPEEARRWRPAAGQWTAHEVIVHCADSEANAHMRIRYILAERDPLIVGYDQDRWTEVLDYHAHPLEPALATIAAVRANTVALLRRLPDEAWTRAGRHTEHQGAYSAERWLTIYAEHLEVHVAQLGRILAAWNARS